MGVGVGLGVRGRGRGRGRIRFELGLAKGRVDPADGPRLAQLHLHVEEEVHVGARVEEVLADDLVRVRGRVRVRVG
jgi:hypothetical protein